MSLDNILKNQKVSRRKIGLPLVALTIVLTGAIPIGLGSLFPQNKISPYENTIEEKKPSKTSEKEKISLKIDGKMENFYYSKEDIKDNELNQGIVVWEKIINKKNRYYPVGHLYVFKDINSREIVGKFAISGGDLENDVKPIRSGIVCLNKFEKWPDYFDKKGNIIYKGGDKDNPWGYGRFYQYPIAEKGNTMEILSKNSFSRYTEPDKQKRYLHGTSDNGEYMGYPKNTIGCTRTNNEAMDFLEETVNEGYFRLAYVDDIK